MKSIYLILINLGFIFFEANAQTSYIVVFKDKATNPYSINSPDKFLSQRAIERRRRFNIAIEENDLPVTPRYVDSVRLSGSVSVRNQSKWLNQICIKTSDNEALTKIKKFSFVSHVFAVDGQSTGRKNQEKFIEKIVESPVVPQYNNQYFGSSFDQIHIHNGEYLHNQNFRGQGMRIAVIDAGFLNYSSLPPLDSVNLQKRILDTYDFVANTREVNSGHPHGLHCFSIMAANSKGNMVGSAPMAEYLLYRSEDVNSEFPVEEQNWIAAAERSDSAGADLISTSLGYSLFDNPSFDYTYKDMNGNTTMMSRAANIATKKGIMLVIAAGNEGQAPWHYISTPADALDVLAIGATDRQGKSAPFSSYGPSSDGRVKPDVSSVGWGTALINTDGSVVSGNGTSFATPNLAGLAACLWQAFPEFNNLEIMDAIRKSGSLYDKPDVQQGYGLPNFITAFLQLTDIRMARNAEKLLVKHSFAVYPNPFDYKLDVVIKPEQTGSAHFQLIDLTGKTIYTQSVKVTQGQLQLIHLNNLPVMNRGMYILKLTLGQKSESIKVMRN